MERKPQQRQQAHYTQDLWGNPVPHRRVSESLSSTYASPNGKRRSRLPALPHPPQTENIIEGIFLTHNNDTTTQLRATIQRRGVSALSNTELVSLVLRTKTGRESIEPRIHNLLANYTMQELLTVDYGVLQEQYQLGEAKAAQLQAMLEVGRRLLIPSDRQEYTIRAPADAANVLRPEMEFLDHEEMRILVLDTKNHIVANLLLYQGTVNSSVLRAAEIFRPAVIRKCPNVLLCHNHPSGDPTPSEEDLEATRHIVDAGKILDVDVVDHLIIGKNHSFVSLREKMPW